MDFSRLPLTQLMARKLAWLGQRSAVLAQNVANADTPDYKARDLKPLDFKSELRRAQGGSTSAAALAVTDVRHMQPSAGAASKRFAEANEAEPFETTLSGNSVSLEQQMSKLGETQHEHQTVIELYRKHLSMFRTALGRGV